MKSINLKSKLVISSLLIGLIPILVVAFFSTSKFSKELETNRFDQLESVRSIKKRSIYNYFEQIKDHGLSLSNNLSTINTLKDLNSSYSSIFKDNNLSDTDMRIIKRRMEGFYQNEFGKKFKEEAGKDSNATQIVKQLSDEALVAQYYFIYKNRNPLGSKHLLVTSEDKSQYSKFHEKYHPNFKEVLERFGYYDIFLVNTKGEIIYSVYKEIDFGTSLVYGPLANSALARSYKAVANSVDADSFHLEDFDNYVASYDAPASFFSTPVFSDRERIGTLIFQMPIEGINKIMMSSEGLGDSGESYLVGSDYLMRSDSRLDPENHSVIASFRNKEKGVVRTEAVKLALAGNEGNKIIKDYNGQDVLSSFTPLEVLDQKWALIAEIDSKEAFAAVEALKNIMIIFAVATVIIIVLIAVYMSKKIADPILNVANDLDTNSTSARSISQVIGQSSHKIAELVTEEAAAIQETVASMEEMSSMINQSNDFAKQSRDLAEEVLEKTIEGDRIMKKLGNSMESIQQSNKQLQNIGDIINDINNKTNVINDIVFKTQLLSFNASIEAARAGQHGKGFAVVAEEVGNLAMMSGKAAGEIRDLLDDSKKQVEQIIDTTKNTVSRGEEVSHEALATFNDISGNISKVTEQLNSIVQATIEQKDGVNQATVAMKQLDAAAKSNSEIARSSSEQGAKLTDITKNLEVLNRQLNQTVLGAAKRKSVSVVESRIEKEVEPMDDKDLAAVTESLLLKSGEINRSELKDNDFV